MICVLTATACCQNAKRHPMLRADGWVDWRQALLDSLASGGTRMAGQLSSSFRPEGPTPPQAGGCAITFIFINMTKDHENVAGSLQASRQWARGRFFDCVFSTPFPGLIIPQPAGTPNRLMRDELVISRRRPVSFGAVIAGCSPY